MKLYCLGNPIKLVKLTYSTHFFDNLPVTGTPIFGKLPVTQDKARAAFTASETLFLCKSLEDAKALRKAKIIVGNTNVTPQLFQGAIASGYPLSDYAIYEIEIRDELATETHFIRLLEATSDQLTTLVNSDLLHKAQYQNSREGIPDISVYSVTKAAINPELVRCHYFSLADEHDELASKSNCLIM